MKVGDLARDPVLVPKSLTPFQRSMRAGFVVVRARAMLRANSSLRDPLNEGEVDAGSVATVKSTLGTKIGHTATAETEILSRVQTEQAAGKLLPLDSAAVDPLLVKSYKASKFVTGTLEDKRREMVSTLVWWAAAVHPMLADPAQIDDLHLVVDRRLRVMERMLYNVAERVRWFDIKAIKAAPTQPWLDGWSRLFEYPRLERVWFDNLCKPDAVDPDACKGPGMLGWVRRGPKYLVHDTKVNPDAVPGWQPTAVGSRVFFYQSGALSPSAAVEKLFEPQNDFMKRNFLFCDEVLHVIHIEALLAARKKRLASLAWFDNLVTGNPAGWLRIDYPWRRTGQLGTPFLVSPKETQYFEHEWVWEGDLQPADHLVVFNHPVYDKASVAGPWRLENAIVVSVYPRVLLQGHGTSALTLAEMKTKMIKLCNSWLNRARDTVTAHLNAASPAASGFPTLAIPGATGKIVRRVEPANSAYASPVRKADWWLNWALDDEKDEIAIATTPARAALAKTKEGVEFVAPGTGGGGPEGGFFPLWQPALKSKNGPPVKNSAGKISKIKPALVDEPMVSAWSWYLPVQEQARGLTEVIRPRV